MFHKTYLKLTGLYLLIIMGIGLFFSAIIYQSAVHEFNQDYARQGVVIERLPNYRPTDRVLSQFLDQRRAEYNQAKAHILNRLVLINLIILGGGGVLSYYLARRTLQPIEEAHQALERFTADASHELRTPLAVMQTENEVALMDPKLTLNEAKSQIKSNLEELAKLAILADGLLRLARQESNPEDHVEVPVETLVSNAIARTAPAAEAKHMLIGSDVKPNLVVKGDQNSLVEAIVTLLDNAIKYSPDKSEVRISAHKVSKNLIIEVKDQGTGIKAGELPHIFERFYRADSARSKQGASGYGLGLAIAKNIIDTHEGSITAKSKPGKGSTFTIQLPLA